MSNVDPNTPSAVAAGWYPDPSGAAGLRWWDGARWTEHTQAHAPAAPLAAQPAAQPQYGQQQYGQQQYAAQPGHAAQPGYTSPAPFAAQAAQPLAPIPADAPVYGPFIWIITLLPAISLLLLPLSLSGVQSAMNSAFVDAYSGSSGYGSTSLQLQLTEAAMNIASLLIYAAGVVLAFFDRRWLIRRGIVPAFHWAFAFIPAPVYPIGRSLQVRRRSGRGIAPMWVAIGLFALSFIIGIAVFIWVMNLMFGMMGSIDPSLGYTGT
ncbi:DUF2510 domain-containing protein [Herbiconiux sp.]|uniref:DUF2510 domain-containing protein n=1 Tax=Herbiconiux sp. TaxID=1871186 RepID=UPI0025B90080|nr:DUF2510 domain-containing protein [Herbiconiux sp.]